MEIVPYQPGDFDRVVAFLRQNWAAEHPVYDQPLFDWQYRGGSACLLVVDDGRVLGFLGNVPGRYLVDGDGWPAAGLSMWCVDRDLRSGGLGVRLIRAAERAHPVTFTLGAGTAVLPMYRAMGYAVLPQLHRYVLPLQAEGFGRLLVEPATVVAGRFPARVLPTPDVWTLADLFDRAVRPAFRFAQARDPGFWWWRYVENVGFQYHRFGDAESGAVVARIEHVHAADRPDVHGLGVLRLIELLPSTPAAWDGHADGPFTSLLAGVLGWAAARGCVAADFQCASSRAAHLLNPLGFQGREQARLAELFAPFRPATAPINFVWKVAAASPVSAEDCYVVKSDCDMDRPALWPVAEPRRIAC